MIKFKFIFCIVSLLAIIQNSTAHDLRYFLPENTGYDKEILKPKDVFGFEVGEFFVSHDNVVSYFEKLAQISPRVKFEIYGYTHEKKKLGLSIISSSENIRNIEAIRLKHLQLSNPELAKSVNVDKMPVVVWLNHSIHGGEASGVNSALLTAYHFAAATGKEIDELLENVIILIEPAVNPDGIQRYSTWANNNRSYMTNSDPASREHSESWPGSRYNHYWFDLNRDWLPLEQPESEFRVKKMLEWKPNVLIDLHEQNTNSNFHFSPGEPMRINPLISPKNQELTQKLANNYAKEFDKAGVFYFSGEQFDDYYIGRGSTFTDLNGGVSLLFEQPTVRGFVQESENGLLTFQLAIKNQFIGSLSTVKTAFQLKKEFLEYQADYYTSAIKEAKNEQFKAYVFGSEYDKNTTFLFAKFLNTHGITSQILKSDLKVGKNNYKAGLSYLVSLEQAQYRLIKSIFDRHLTPKDSVFYDVSAWNIAQAYNLPFDELKSYAGIEVDKFSELQIPKGKIFGDGNPVAYVMKWNDGKSPKALSRLLSENLKIKVATKSFETLKGEKFEKGSILIPLGIINQNHQRIENIIADISANDGVDFLKFHSGDNAKIDLGSSTFQLIAKPRIAVVTDEGISGISAGQIWHLLDTKFKLPFTLLPSRQFKQGSLSRYNVIILPAGSYQDFDEKTAAKLQEWISLGNTVIALESSISWLNKYKVIQAEFEKEDDKILGMSYENSILFAASREVAGTVFETKLDLSHPINFGYVNDLLPVFKDNRIVQIKAENIAANYPARYSKNSLLDGYSPKGFTEILSGTPAIGIFGVKRGRVIAFYNNPNFRGYWLSTNRQLANSIFFGDKIRLTNSRVEY